MTEEGEAAALRPEEGEVVARRPEKVEAMALRPVARRRPRVGDGSEGKGG